jgi:hypothetical protein
LNAGLVSSLKELNVSNTEIGDGVAPAFFEALRSAPGLEILNIAETNLGGPLTAFAFAKHVPFMSMIKDLDISGNLIAGALPSDAEGEEQTCAHGYVITRVSCEHGCNAENNDEDVTAAVNSHASCFTALCEALKLSGITKLNFSKCSIDQHEIRALAQVIPFMPKLKHLNVCGNPIGDDLDTEGVCAVLELYEAMCSSSIEVFNISDCGIGPQGTFALARFLPSILTLSELDISKADIGVDDAIALAMVLPETNVQSLTVGENADIVVGATKWDFSIKQKLSLAELTMFSLIIPSAPTVNELNLRGKTIVGSITGIESTSIKPTMLKNFALSNFEEEHSIFHEGCFVTEDGKCWGELNKYRTDNNQSAWKVVWLEDGRVQYLHRRFPNSGDEFRTHDFIAAVAVGADKWQLQQATVSKAVYGGIDVLCGGLQAANILILNVSKVNLNAAGLTHFTMIIHACTSLISLNLDENHLTGASSEVDVSSGYCTPYGARVNPFDDSDLSGLAALCDAMTRSSIRKLSVAKCCIGPKAISTLAEYISDIMTLNELNLSGNHLSSTLYAKQRHAYHFSEARRAYNGVIKYDCDLSGISNLLRAMKSSSITTINLSKCVLGQNSVNSFLEHAPFISNLSNVDLTENHISYHVHDTIKSALPKVRFMV